MPGGGGVQLGGAYFELTADNADLIKTLVASERQAKASSAAIARSIGASASEVDSALKKLRRGQEDASGGFGNLLRSGAALGAGFAGVTSSINLARAAIGSIVEATQKANQAQFALNATYRSSSAALNEFAAAQAAATKRTIADVQESLVAFGSLSNRYAVTSDQVKELTKRSADLAAVKGMTTVEAAKRLEAALRGEAEAAEALGLTLNDDYMKKFAVMTAEQRKNWETLDPLVKVQIRYQELLRQTDPLLGSAAKRTTEAAGAADNLNTAWNNLALTLGKNLTPSIEQSQNWLARWIETANEWLKKHREIQQAQGISTETAISVGRGPDARPGRPGAAPAEDTPAAQAQAAASASSLAAAIDDVRKRQEQAAAAARDRARAELEAADAVNKTTVDAAIKAIDAERKAKERWYAEERDRIEARRTYILEDIETRKKAALEAIEAEAEAAREALEAAIERAELEKQARIDAAQAAADAAKDAIEAERDRLTELRRLEDRASDDERRAEDRATDDARRTEDRARAAAQKQILDDINERKEAMTAALDDEAEAAERTRDRKIRALDREADKVREASARRKRAIDDEADAEAERHRQAVQALEDERDARLEVLDAQLAQLDAAEKAEAAARRTADLQQRVTAAQAAASRARGTGTPEQIAEARLGLTSALRGGDEISIANARERLVQLAGHGAEAIREADEELAEAQQELRDEGVENARDAERDKLKAAQDAVRDETEIRKRAEDDRNREREKALEQADRAEQAATDRQLKRIEARKQAVQDETKRIVDDVKERREAQQQALEEEQEAEQERFEQDTTRLEDRRREEDRFRDDTRREQDRFRDDERRAQDRALAEQLEAVDKNLAAERTLIEAHYNGPNGVITQLRKAVEASALEYSKRLAAATASFEAERKAAERVFTNPEKTGLLDLLEKARADEFAKLEQSKLEWTEWGRVASEAIKAALADLNAFIAAGSNIPRIGGDTPAQRSAGSGKNTAASSSRTRSGRSGKEVQGDVSSWLNDAIDITGVSDDWIVGLQRLVSLESSGDPHNWNPTAVGGEHATGLLQMLPSTFRRHRDKSLPDDIYDPVANAVASIRYIIDTYKHVDNIKGLYKGKFEGYARGGWLTEPILGVGASGSLYTLAERGPEYVSPAGVMAGAIRSARGAGGYGGDTFNYAGVAPESIFHQFRRDQRRAGMLRGARGLLRGV